MFHEFLTGSPLSIINLKEPGRVTLDNKGTLLGAEQFMSTISLLDATKDKISNLKSMRLNTFVIVMAYTLKVLG